MPESDRAAFASIVRKRHQLYVLIWALNFVLGYLYSDSTGICNLGFVFSCWYCILFGEKNKSFQTVAWLLVHHGVRLCRCCSSDCRPFILFKVGETICISEEQDIQYCCQFCICSVISGDFALPCAWGCRRWTSSYSSTCNLRDVNAHRAALEQLSEHVSEQDCTRIVKHLVPIIFFVFQIPEIY